MIKSSPTENSIRPLIVEPYNEMKNKKQCKRNHPAHFNCKILGSTKRFCTYQMDVKLTEGGIRVIECGDYHAKP